MMMLDKAMVMMWRAVFWTGANLHWIIIAALAFVAYNAIADALTPMFGFDGANLVTLIGIIVVVHIITYFAKK